MRSFSDSQLVSCIPHLRRYAYGLVRNAPEADDLLQDTLTRALEYEARFDGGNLIGWLVTIMKRRCIDIQRSARRRGMTISLDELFSAEFESGGWGGSPFSHANRSTMLALSTPPAQLAHLEFADLQRGLREIRPDLGAIATGIGFGYTPEEIGRQTGLQPNQVRSRVWRSRMWLRDYTAGQERSRRLWVPR